MMQRFGESLWRQSESYGHHHTKDTEKDEVGNENYLADGEKATELMRGLIEYDRQRASCHVCGEPSPCEMLESLFDASASVRNLLFATFRAQ